MSRAAVCVHHRSLVSIARLATYVAISTTIRNAITPDWYDSSPNHLGRRMNRRTNNPVIEIATRMANTAASRK
jgi:hypothetical protein